MYEREIYSQFLQEKKRFYPKLNQIENFRFDLNEQNNLVRFEFFKPIRIWVFSGSIQFMIKVEYSPLLVYVVAR